MKQSKVKKINERRIFRINYCRGAITLPKEWWQKVGVDILHHVELRTQGDKNLVIEPLKRVETDELFDDLMEAIDKRLPKRLRNIK